MVVIPYPLRLDSVRRGADDSEDFNRALAFATASGDIALDEGSTPDSVANELALIGQRTGFTSYALLGTPEYLVQFRLIRNLVLSNALLVVCTSALLAAVLLGLAAVVSWQLSSLRRGRDVALWNLGCRMPAMPRRRQASCWSAWDFHSTGTRGLTGCLAARPSAWRWSRPS